MRGTKRFEYRSRPTAIRERVYIYASLKPGAVWTFGLLVEWLKAEAKQRLMGDG